MKKQLWSLLLLTSVSLATAQISQNSFADLQYNGQGKLFYASLSANSQITEAATPAFLNQLLGTPYEVTEFRSERDELGISHKTYQITLEGKPLSGKRIVAHFKNGRLGWINGDLQVARASENASFSLDEGQALSAALAKVNAVKYRWDNIAEEEHMRQVLNDPSFTYYPHGEQVWFEKDGMLHPAWKFNIYAEEPLYRADVFVHAASGAVIEEHNQICSANVTGTAVTKYSGTNTITCDQNTITNVYRLRQTTSGQGVETYNLKNTTNYGAASDFTNTSANWNLSAFDQGALDAHWGAEMTYDYYMTNHNRNSINNFGMKLISYVHYGNNYSNAFWDGQRMTYGDGNGGSTRIFSALDVCGHEITHGVNDFAGDLVYSYESGALSESFSDIFGTAIENFARPGNWNWRIGEDLTSNGSGLRSMQAPKSFGDPNCYKGSYWYSGAADNGGVHTNSGVPNYWFYLLTTGGAGTNDVGNAFNVQGLGIYDAARIAYRAFAFYFTPYTDFAAARIACIQAAKDIFGDCSFEMIQTANAWYAVNVGQEISATAVLPDFTTKVTSFCNLPAPVSFSNTTPYGTAYQWSFGDGTSSMAMNPVHTYTTPGSYNVKLTATGCGGTDSIVKSAFIVVSPPSAPSVVGSTVCYGSPANAMAVGDGMLQWYTSPTSSSSIQSGTMISVPGLTGTTTYYIDNTYTFSPVVGGKTNAAGGNFLTNNAQFLEFDVHENCLIHTVQMNSNGSGLRTVELRNSSNFVLDTRTVNLVFGLNTVTLDLAVPVGTGYQLGLSGPTSPGVFRSNSGVSYPYTVGNMITITGSSAGAGLYYWFFTWKVIKDPCVSPRTAVTVSTMPLPVINLNAPVSKVCIDDEQLPIFAFPMGGTFTGPGMQGSDFNPSLAGSGTHTISYTFTDENGCSDAAEIVLEASECTGVSSFDIGKIAVFPNPANGSAVVSGVQKGSIVSLHDNTGRLLRWITPDSQEMKLDLQEFAKGLYMVRVSDANGNTGTVRLVVD